MMSLTEDVTEKVTKHSENTEESRHGQKQPYHQHNPYSTLYKTQCYLHSYVVYLTPIFHGHTYFPSATSLGVLLLLAHCALTPTAGVNVIKLGIILPHVGRYPWIVNNTVPGIRYAVDSIHNRSDLLLNHELHIHIGDSQCSETYGPLVAIDMYLKKMAHVFLGPVCDYSVAPIARFSPHWNIPVISAGALVQAFQNKEEYAQLTRISGSYAKLGSFISQMFDEYTWSISGLIYSDFAESSRSDCFFVMEAVYHSLRETLQKRHGNKNVWYKSFDERSKPPTYNLTNILTDGSHETRSKHNHQPNCLTLYHM